MSTATAPSRRTRARRGDGERLRAQILAAADRLLAEAGSSDAVSVRAIARACDVTPPAIYLHFSDKAQLFAELSNARGQELARRIDEAARSSEDALEALRAVCAASVRFAVDHPEAYRFLVTAETSYKNDGQVSAGPFGNVAAAVRRCFATGAFDGADPHKTALVVWSGVQGLASVLDSQSGPRREDRDAVIEHMLDVLIEGLLSV